MNQENSNRRDVTALLDRVRSGDNTASDQLLSLVYTELRGLAGAVFMGQGSDHTLQPTALVHEAYLKLVGHFDRLDSRKHFFVLAGKAMRQVLADHARGNNAEKRGGNRRQVTLDTNLDSISPSCVDLVSLDECLQRLADLNPRHAKVVDLRIFSGFSVEETAEILELSPRSIKADWAMAKAWLRRELDSAD